MRQNRCTEYMFSIYGLWRNIYQQGYYWKFDQGPTIFTPRSPRRRAPSDLHPSLSSPPRKVIYIDDEKVATGLTTHHACQPGSDVFESWEFEAGLTSSERYRAEIRSPPWELPFFALTHLVHILGGVPKLYVLFCPLPVRHAYKLVIGVREQATHSHGHGAKCVPPFIAIICTNDSPSFLVRHFIT